MIEYSDSLSGIKPEHLHGFFSGWRTPPSPRTHLLMLQKSTHVVVAKETGTPIVVGYISALSDDVLFACISSLEVLPEFQKQGIGRELMRLILEKLQHLYAVDLVCDAEIQTFYEKCGMVPLSGMCRRNYSQQSGARQERGTTDIR